MAQNGPLQGVQGGPLQGVQGGPPQADDAAELNAQLGNATTAQKKQTGDASWISFMSEEQLVRELEQDSKKIKEILEAYKISKLLLKNDNTFTTFGLYLEADNTIPDVGQLVKNVTQMPNVDAYLQEYELFIDNDKLKTEMFAADDYRRLFWKSIDLNDPAKNKQLNDYINFELFHRYLGKELDRLHKRYIELVDKYLYIIQKASPYIHLFPPKQTLQDLLENNPTKPDLILWRSMIDSLFTLYKINKDDKQYIKLDQNDPLFTVKRDRFKKDRFDDQDVKFCLKDSIKLIATKQVEEFIQLYSQIDNDTTWGYRGSPKAAQVFKDGIETYVRRKTDQELQTQFANLLNNQPLQKDIVSKPTFFTTKKTRQQIKNLFGYGSGGGKLKKLTLKKKRSHR